MFPLVFLYFIVPIALAETSVSCHTIVLSPTRASSVENFCEHDDDYPLMNNRGERVKVKALVEFCNTTKCNDRELFDGCTGSPTNELINSQVLDCNECSPSEGRNCYKDEGKCSAKRYCTKQIVMLNRMFLKWISADEVLFGHQFIWD
uniref:Pacifastin domain-containing protein n=1 Tax=Heterorhabditis bacteriophora TaxID=37862 RepID=A0A1I7WN85_HETBA